jgi:hypothetical protein
MDGICRPLSPLNLAAFFNQQLPTYAKALPLVLSGFTSELPALRISLLAFSNTTDSTTLESFAGLLQPENPKLCRPFPIQQLHASALSVKALPALLTFVNFFVVDLRVYASAGLFFCPLLPAVFASICQPLPAVAYMRRLCCYIRWHLPTSLELNDCQPQLSPCRPLPIFCCRFLKKPLPTFLAGLSCKPFTYFCRPLPTWETKVYILSMYTYDDVCRPFQPNNYQPILRLCWPLPTFCCQPLS